MTLCSRQRRTRQAASLLSLALAVTTAGCQSTDAIVWRMGFQQPDVVAQQQADPPAQRLEQRPTIRPTIRPGHSFDVDHDANINDDTHVRLVAASQENNDVEPATETEFGYQSLPGYPIPPPPMPLRGKPGSVGDAHFLNGSRDGRMLPIGFGFLQRSVSGENRDLTADNGAVRNAIDGEAKSPNLASPFSLRRLYEKLRPKKSRPEGPTADDRVSESSTRVCEYNEINPASPDGLASPVSLGLPDAEADNDMSQAGTHRSAVTQACPSDFHQPLSADSNDIEEYKPQ